MLWNKIIIKTTTEAEDVVVSNLYDLGVEGVQIMDNVPLTPLEKEQMFIDILPNTIEDDGEAYLIAYNELNQAALSKLLDEIMIMLEETRNYIEIGEGSVSIEIVDDIDWIDNWKKYFHQFHIGDILICPTWEEPVISKKDCMLLRIDPGTAFGTGKHETTKLCIESIKDIIMARDRVLDIGCGSGILGIIALKLGAKEVVATELDTGAIPAIQDNLDNNGISKNDFELVVGNIITDSIIQDKVGYGRYDIIVANILAEVLMPLLPHIAKALSPNGKVILSGIIDNKKDTMIDALVKMGYEVLSVNEDGEWIGIVAKLINKQS